MKQILYQQCFCEELPRLSEVVGDPDYDRGGCLCYLRRAPHHLGQSHSHHGRATHGVFSYDELMNYVKRNKNNKMHKYSLQNVHREGCTLSFMAKRTKRQRKANYKKKQRKILAENSWLAKFVLTAKDVFDRNTNSQTLPEKKSLLSCILNFRNQLEDFTLTISC